VGNRVAENTIHDLPHFGIWLHGNEHVIERNEIHHVCLETNDAGAFYMGRDFSERGNVIRHNYFHDLGEGDLVQGVYLDDCASGTTVAGNVFIRAGRGIMIGGGRDNTVTDNFFESCRPAVHVDARGIGWASSWFDDRDPTLFKRLTAVRHDRHPYSEAYPELVTLLDDRPAFPKGNRITGNTCVESRWLDLLDDLAEQDIEMTDNLIFPLS
jgi:parallel beta-helix repeat protein